MTLTELLMAWWPVIGAALGFVFTVIVWGIRLEGLVKMNRNDMKHLEDRQDRQDNDIKIGFAKLDARLEAMNSSLEKVIWRIPRTIREELRDGD